MNFIVCKVSTLFLRLKFCTLLIFLSTLSIHLFSYNHHHVSPVKLNFKNNKVRDLSESILLAECANLCNSAEKEVHQQLSSRTRINMCVTCHDVAGVEARYNVVEFDELALDGSTQRKRVIAIRGSRSARNIRDAADTAFEFDDILKINVHRGFRRVYTAILNDLPKYAFKNVTEDGKPIQIYVTGHSLGGVCACLLATALVEQGILVKRVSAFGMPMFTDRMGRIKLSKIPIERVQHIYDPVGIGPTFPNILLVHVGAAKEIFLTLWENSAVSESTVDAVGSSSDLFSRLFSTFAEYDRRGRKLENEAENYEIYVGKN
jgi:hypothetical protein